MAEVPSLDWLFLVHCILLENNGGMGSGCVLIYLANFSFGIATTTVGIISETKHGMGTGQVEFVAGGCGDTHGFEFFFSLSFIQNKIKNDLLIMKGFVLALAIMKLVDVVLSHGGQPMIQSALAAGVPIERHCFGWEVALVTRRQLWECRRNFRMEKML